MQRGDGLVALPCPGHDPQLPHRRHGVLGVLEAQVELERLPGRVLTAKAEVSGEFGGRTFPADEALELKRGARVMFLRNDQDQRWVNGTTGTVTKVRDTVFVEVPASADGAGLRTPKLRLPDPLLPVLQRMARLNDAILRAARWRRRDLFDEAVDLDPTITDKQHAKAALAQLLPDRAGVLSASA